MKLACLIICFIAITQVSIAQEKNKRKDTSQVKFAPPVIVKDEEPVKFTPPVIVKNKPTKSKATKSKPKKKQQVKFTPPVIIKDSVR